MLTKLDADTCHSCPHELVTGVACDWRPADECPYLRPQETARRTVKMQLMPIALSTETDAIRSID